MTLGRAAQTAPPPPQPLSPTEMAAVNAATQLVGMTSRDITAAITSGDAVSQAQIASQVQIQLASLRQQQMTPQNQANIAALTTLQNMLASQQGGGNNVLVMFAIGAGVILVLGSFWIMSQGSGKKTRRNPARRRVLS
jgi:hypothetical protein